MTYLVLAGGTDIAELYTYPRLIAGLLGVAFIATYVMRLPRSFDGIDVTMLASLVLFLIACVMSQFPRQSFDSALVAFTYLGMFHFARGRLANDPDRRNLVWILRLLSFSVALTVALAWTWTAFEYARITGRAPPLDLKYITTPWGHRHDVTLLVLLLAPAWFVGSRNRLGGALATAALSATAVVVVLDGSRTMWLAAGVALACVATPAVWRRLREWSPRSRQLQWPLASVAVGLMVLILIAPEAGRRLTDFGTLAARGQMWAAAGEIWLKQPVFGLGAGTFPWLLQTTSYFEANSWAPRHPDSSLFRLLAEGGTFGVAAGAMVVVGIFWAMVRHGRSRVATFPIIAFAIATISADPTEFGFLVGATLAWTAYALPRPAASKSIRAPERHAIAAATTWSAIGIILAAVIAFGIASASHDAVGRGVADGRTADALTALDVAISYDPGMALYWRERGILRLINGEIETAKADLYRAHELNGSDDVTMRALAVAAVEQRDFEIASGWIDEALATQRADVLNQLLAARVYRLAGDNTAARAMLAEIVQGYPWITGTPSWSAELPPGTTNSVLAAAAVENWQRGELGAVPFESQPVWLVEMADVPALAEEAAGLSGPVAIAPTITALIRCDAKTASMAIAKAPPNEIARPIYWSVRAAVANLAGSGGHDNGRIFGMTAGYGLPNGSSVSVDVLDETRTLGLTVDEWGYHRVPSPLPRSPVEVPNPEHGLERWLFSTASAAAVSGVNLLNSQCGDN